MSNSWPNLALRISFTHSVIYSLAHSRDGSCTPTGWVWSPVLQGLVTYLGKPTQTKLHMIHCNGDLWGLKAAWRFYRGGVVLNLEWGEGVRRQERKEPQVEKAQHSRLVNIWLLQLSIVIKHLGPWVVFPLQTKNITNSWVLWNSSNNRKMLWKYKMQHEFSQSLTTTTTATTTTNHTCCFILTGAIQGEGQTQLPKEVGVGDVRTKILLWREKGKSCYYFNI